MTTQAEHAQSPAVVRVSEMVGISTAGWEDAVRRVVARASQSIRHITGVNPIRSTAVVSRRPGSRVSRHCQGGLIVEPAAIVLSH